MGSEDVEGVPRLNDHGIMNADFLELGRPGGELGLCGRGRRCGWLRVLRGRWDRT
jgi:hypothetical protein